MTFHAFNRRPGFRPETKFGNQRLLVSYDLNRTKNYLRLHAAMGVIDPQFRRIQDSLYEVRCVGGAEWLYSMLRGQVDIDDNLLVIDPKAVVGSSACPPGSHAMQR